MLPTPLRMIKDRFPYRKKENDDNNTKGIIMNKNKADQWVEHQWLKIQQTRSKDKIMHAVDSDK